MQSYLLHAALAMIVATASLQVSAGPTSGTVQLVQNSAAVDRTLGNGSMGTGEGIDRLPEQLDKGYDVRDQRVDPDYEQGSHGDTDTDMEHRPRKTLGDEDQD
ncbi:hypothetical protein [Stutzerimonas zhaodongensis]|uniref:hypothetical protein n=1 Tax=Stutzerimonas TaxID=2901164 RepID=UPI00388D8C92